jgi:single-strand DNA-binding protein
LCPENRAYINDQPVNNPAESHMAQMREMLQETTDDTPF